VSAISAYEDVIDFRCIHLFTLLFGEESSEHFVVK